MKENKHFFPFLVSILPPSVFMLYLYQQNAAYLSFWHVLIAIVIFTSGAAILQLFVSKLIKSSEIAALINNVLWILFFSIKALYRFLSDFFENSTLTQYIFSGIMGVITIIVITLIIKNKNKLRKQEIFKIVSVFWFTILIFNVIPAFIYHKELLKIHSKRHCEGDSTKQSVEKNIKTDFNVDTNLPSPNIYWLFMDGMLGFKAMEYLFDDPQSEFTAQLTERGFIINREAQFEALHLTMASAPAMMSPHYYDTFLLPSLQNCDLNDYKQKIKFRDDIRKNTYFACSKNELIAAFEKKGYQTNTVCLLGNLMHTNFYTSYLYIDGRKINCDDIPPEVLINLVAASNGKDLLYETLPGNNFIFYLFSKYENSKLKAFSTVQNYYVRTSDDFTSFFGKFYEGYDRWYLYALVDILKNSSKPALTIICDSKAHSPFIYDEQGSLNRLSSFDPSDYPSQHYFASSVVISYIDLILYADPEAVIVLQSDHGLHHKKSRQQLISKYGGTDDDVRLMQNQTISAVRIPDLEKEEQPIEPLNITRSLVNRYVGDNYKLLDAVDIVK